MKCTTCKGSGRVYSVAFWDGVAECGSCEGSGEDPETPCTECDRTYGDHLDAWREGKEFDHEFMSHEVLLTHMDPDDTI